MQQCRDAAGQILRLGRWICKLSPRQKLLHQEAHALFNAAVILLLHQLAFPDLGTYEASDLDFDIDVFQREANLGNDFGVDCAKALQDLRHLVQGLRRQSLHLGEQPVMPGPAAVSGGTTTPTEGGILGAGSSMEEHGTLYRELQAWLDNDFLDLYNDYLD